MTKAILHIGNLDDIDKEINRALELITELNILLMKLGDNVTGCYLEIISESEVINE